MKRHFLKHISGRISYLILGLLICLIFIAPEFERQVVEVKDRDVFSFYHAGCNQGLIKGVDWNPEKFRQQSSFCVKNGKEFLQNYKEISKKIEEYSR